MGNRFRISIKKTIKVISKICRSWENGKANNQRRKITCAFWDSLIFLEGKASP
jgi:hypothetical protein